MLHSSEKWKYGQNTAPFTPWHNEPEMESVFLAEVINTKIIHLKSKSNRASFVWPQARHILGLKIAFFVQTFFKDSFGNKASTRKAVHSLICLEMDGTIFVNDIAEFILVNHFFWNVAYVEANVFWAFNRRCWDKSSKYPLSWIWRHT